MDGPRMVSPPRIIEISTLACCSWSRGTSCGITLARAGMLRAVDVPISAARQAICQICAWPLSTSAAIAELTGAGHEVAALDDEGAAEPVGDHAAGEHEDHHRDAVGGEHRAERAGGVADLEHRERQGDTGHGAADHVDEARGEVPPEVGDAQRSERVRAGHRSIRNAATVRLVLIVPLVRGRWACSWTSSEARFTSSVASLHTSGLTQSSASVKTAGGSGWRWPNRRTQLCAHGLRPARPAPRGRGESARSIGWR